MSIHAAKGLEFPVVCVADLGREANLRVPDLLFDEAGGRLGLRLRRLGDPESVSALAYEQLRDERRVAQEEEEDRVLYVACTRAENRLLLSGSVAFERWPAIKAGRRADRMDGAGARARCAGARRLWAAAGGGSDGGSGRRIEGALHVSLLEHGRAAER